MKVKELVYSVTGTAPISKYGNLKPLYSMKVQLEEGDNSQEIFLQIQKQVRNLFDVEVSAAKAEHIKSLYDNMRFYTTPDGKKYPSVTTILGWDKDFHITEEELKQYGARGTIIHKLIEEYFTSYKWLEISELEGLDEELATVLNGSLKLTIDGCSHKKFFEKFSKDFGEGENEVVVFNDELKFAGRADRVGLFQGKRSVIDYKTGVNDFAQLAAYASCLEGIEQLVKIPIGESTTKQGYSKPEICTDIGMQFDRFKKARTTFRKRFGC